MLWLFVACFCVRVSVTFHLPCVHIIFSSVCVAEWPPFCPPPFRRKVEGHSFRLSVLPSVLPSFRPSVRLSVPLKYYVPCVRNSSYSFMPIHLKLYKCFCHGLKVCMWFGYYPEIIFCHFFRSLNLAIFRRFYYQSE